MDFIKLAKFIEVFCAETKSIHSLLDKDAALALERAVENMSSQQKEAFVELLRKL